MVPILAQPLEFQTVSIEAKGFFGEQPKVGTRAITSRKNGFIKKIEKMNFFFLNINIRKGF